MNYEFTNLTGFPLNFIFEDSEVVIGVNKKIHIMTDSNIIKFSVNLKKSSKIRNMFHIPYLPLYYDLTVKANYEILIDRPNVNVSFYYKTCVGNAKERYFFVQINQLDVSILKSEFCVVDEEEIKQHIKQTIQSHNRAGVISTIVYYLQILLWEALPLWILFIHISKNYGVGDAINIVLVVLSISIAVITLIKVFERILYAIFGMKKESGKINKHSKDYSIYFNVAHIKSIIDKHE